MSTILVIDDDVNALKLLGYTLRKAGFNILLAQNGFEGLSKAEEHIPDLIVSDLMMPRMDGYEVTRRLRANPKTQHIPIIILTAKSQVQDKVAGFEAGANDYVTKPVMPAELIARIKAQLAARPVTTATGTLKARARLIGFVGAKGGVGLTTLLVNTGLALQKSGKKVLLADFKSAGGNVCQMLGHATNNDLLTILRNPNAPILPDDIGRAMMRHASGLTMLPPIHGVYARYHPLDAKQAKAILNIVDANVDYVFIDLGSAMTQAVTAALKMCHQVCIVTEPNLLAFDQTRRITQYLSDVGLNTNNLGAVLVNRSRTGHGFTLSQIKEILKLDVWGIISPVPELAHQAMQAKTTMIELQPDHIVSQQFEQLVPTFTSTT